MSNGKLKIYLADLDHFFHGNRIAVPFNVASIASYCKGRYRDELDILLFKHPENLMREIRRSPPHILGLSFYMWNVNLSLRVMECCKHISPSTLTVIGGASVARISDRYKALLSHNKSLDAVVLDHGEMSFANILDRILSKGFKRDAFFAECIPGCAIRLNNTESIARGDIIDNNEYVSKIPSVYLSGYLDSFLEAGFVPQLETTRGCPYNCTYCECGDKFFSKVVARDEDIIYEELLYLLKHSKSKELIVTDSNFGIMGERDLRIISFMLKLYKKYNFPYVSDISSAKVKTRACIEVMKNAAKIRGTLYLGLQTLTERVLRNCKRKNITRDTMKELVNIAREDNLFVAADLIFGLPGETVESFIKSVSELVSLGVVKPSIYQLRLLPGTVMAEKEREKYRYSTKFRPFNNKFGEYNLIPGEKPARIIEVEEIAYENSTVNRHDYMAIREYGFMIELLLDYGAFAETILYLFSRGINVTEIIKIIQENSNQYPKLSALFNDYRVCSKQELFETEEDLIKNISKDDDQWNDLLLNRGSYFKINLGFVGYCLFENVEILDNIEQIIKRNTAIKGWLPSEEMENLNEVFRKDRLHRIIQKKKKGRLMASDIEEKIYVKERFDYKKWKLNSFKGRLSEYKLKSDIQAVYYIKKYGELKQKIKEYSIFSRYNFYERILLYAPYVSLRRYFG